MSRGNAPHIAEERAYSGRTGSIELELWEFQLPDREVEVERSLRPP